MNCDQASVYFPYWLISSLTLFERPKLYTPVLLEMVRQKLWIDFRIGWDRRVLDDICISFPE